MSVSAKHAVASHPHHLPGPLRHRTIALLIAAAAIAAPSLESAAISAEKPTRPNIVVILADAKYDSARRT
jgi:hypothetical protein